MASVPSRHFPLLTDIDNDYWGIVRDDDVRIVEGLLSYQIADAEAKRLDRQAEVGKLIIAITGKLRLYASRDDYSAVSRLTAAFKRL